jgi:hypothetical protein
VDFARSVAHAGAQVATSLLPDLASRRPPRRAVIFVPAADRYIEQVARDALQAAHTDLGKARRTLLPVAGVLALIHLLTVYPYLETSREMARIEAAVAANAGLLAQLEPEIEKLQEASAGAGAQLTALLEGVTAEMVESFAGLRLLVARALEGETPAALSPDAAMPMPPMQMQMPMPQANLPPDPMQAPPGSAGPFVASPELRAILGALAAGEAAWDELIDYARRDIVEAAYARAAREWGRRIRPAYLRALAESTESARGVAEQASETATQTAAALRAAADEMTRQRAVLEAIELRHDHVVEEALGTDWWHTVEGKGAYADAVAQSVAGEMEAIMQAAQAPSEAIRAALALQEDLRDALLHRQDELAQQFAEQRVQLAGLSGTAGVVPVDLVSFIGLFPLVLGLVLGFMLWRVGHARHQGALAAVDLALAAPDDAATRAWLARRVLGGSDARAAMFATIALAAGALLWIAFAAWQIGHSPGEPPLSPWTSGTLAALVVLVAAAWDIDAIRRLAAQLRPD